MAPRSTSSATREPRDEKAIGAVAVRERLQELRHGRMLPDRDATAQVIGREIGVLGQERLHDALVLGGRDRAGRVDEGTAGLRRGRSGAQDPRLETGELGGPVLLVPAGVGTARERAEV